MRALKYIWKYEKLWANSTKRRKKFNDDFGETIFNNEILKHISNNLFSTEMYETIVKTSDKATRQQVQKEMSDYQKLDDEEKSDV